MAARTRRRKGRGSNRRPRSIVSSGDGCDVVGMTGMPEAALARELGMNYAHCVVVSNRAAGRSTEALTMEMIRVNLESGVAKVRRLLGGFVAGG